MDYGFLGWIVIGLVAGVLAKWIMPGRDPGGVIVTIMIGIAGGLLGGFVGKLLGISSTGNALNIIIATAGAVLLLWVYRLLQTRSA
jgi:uncharacterized membrane protein YeaQ/YmgE (transglycosylase-associated protein family)